MNGPALVIGYGNPLRGDDGIGWRVADQLAGSSAPLEALARVQLTPELVASMAEAARVIFVDASVSLAPGEVGHAPLAPEAAAPAAFSHACTLGGLLGLTRDLYGVQPAAWVVSIGADWFDYSEILSPPVEAALPVALDLVRALAAGQEGTIGAAAIGAAIIERVTSLA